MAHSTSKAMLGTTASNVKEISNHKGSIAAGLAVRLKSDDTLSVAAADGALLGISVGVDQSDIGYTAYCRKGLGVPVKLATGFNPVIGTIVYLDDTSGEAAASGAGKTAVNAVYATGRLGGSGATGGIAEAATSDTGTVGVALIDFPGGL